MIYPESFYVIAHWNGEIVIQVVSSYYTRRQLVFTIKRKTASPPTLFSCWIKKFVPQQFLLITLFQSKHTTGTLESLFATKYLWQAWWVCSCGLSFTYKEAERKYHKFMKIMGLHVWIAFHCSNIYITTIYIGAMEGYTCSPMMKITKLINKKIDGWFGW